MNRLIVNLTKVENKLFKTKSFKKPVYIGDPLNTLKLFNELIVDELIITEIEYSDTIDYSYIEKIVTNSFIPITYAGNIRSIDQVKNLFKTGIEKICINTMFYHENSYEFLTEITGIYGNQSLITQYSFF